MMQVKHLMAMKEKEPTFDERFQCSQLQTSSSEKSNGDGEY